MSQTLTSTGFVESMKSDKETETLFKVCMFFEELVLKISVLHRYFTLASDDLDSSMVLHETSFFLMKAGDVFDNVLRDIFAYEDCDLFIGKFYLTRATIVLFELVRYYDLYKHADKIISYHTRRRLKICLSDQLEDLIDRACHYLMNYSFNSEILHLIILKHQVFLSWRFPNAYEWRTKTIWSYDSEQTKSVIRSTGEIAIWQKVEPLFLKSFTTLKTGSALDFPPYLAESIEEWQLIWRSFCGDMIYDNNIHNYIKNRGYPVDIPNQEQFVDVYVELWRECYQEIERDLFKDLLSKNCKSVLQEFYK